MQSFHLVGPLRRLQALAIDLTWLALAALPGLWASLPPDGPWRGGALFGGLLLLSLGVVPCWLIMGATPGQLIMGQRVVDAGGEPQLSLQQALSRWALAWVGLVAAGVGLLWMCFDARRQGWQDKLAGTLVVDLGADDTPASVTTQSDSSAAHAALQDVEPAPSYLLAHLQGELPLGRSLWINGLLLPLPLALALGAVEAWTRLHGSGQRLGAIVPLLGWPLLLLVLSWGLVGVWRAAGRPPVKAAPVQRLAAAGAAAGGLAVTIPPALVARVLGGGARLLMSLVMGGAGLHVIFNQGPLVIERVSLLVGIDPLGKLDAQVSSDGRRLQLKGPLAQGDAARVQAVLAASPQLRWVMVESSAGRLDEAMQIAALVRSRGLPTRATGECSGVCPFVFLAGSRRDLLPGARLGFQRLSAGRFNPPYQGLVNRAFKARLVAAGLTPHLATKAVATPPSTLWFPDTDELSAAGLVSMPDRPLDVDLPEHQGAALADYAEALSASPLWQALEARFEGAQAAAAARMHAASASGVDAVHVAGHGVVAALMPTVLSRASPETRWLYTEILLAQIDALRLLDAAACRNLLLGDPLAHRRLPPKLAWREAEWLLSALRELPRNVPHRQPSALELEVMRRTLGPRAPAQLRQIWRPGGSTPSAARDSDCRLAHALLSELGSLPAPERRLALRLMYERE